MLKNICLFYENIHSKKAWYIHEIMLMQTLENDKKKSIFFQFSVKN